MILGLTADDVLIGFAIGFWVFCILAGIYLTIKGWREK